MNTDLNLNELICRYCHLLKDKHEDWIATGEYAKKVVCPSELNELGQALKVCFFGPMTNLEYLEYKANEKTMEG